jgi:hypothetical protein
MVGLIGVCPAAAAAAALGGQTAARPVRDLGVVVTAGVPLLSRPAGTRLTIRLLA